MPFETVIIGRYHGREASAEDAILEIYYVGASMRRVEESTEAFYMSRVLAHTLSEAKQNITGTPRTGPSSRSKASALSLPQWTLVQAQLGS